ncbi:hypothetical protein K432DRAFT_377739 [Lepidopterella palustris CBS 459.81]|uniref:Uncharacterized protein n=1 Tax=Lepidopterella palustris CBS 459.81 TaxID=1314670 RepID=A0A8E2EKC2_9PEZI|nr:hypothetical protein K432DRAFT_377739 [Lepidopterella palustris CBS 459.81]
MVSLRAIWIQGRRFRVAVLAPPAGESFLIIPSCFLFSLLSFLFSQFFTLFSLSSLALCLTILFPPDWHPHANSIPEHIDTDFAIRTFFITSAVTTIGIRLCRLNLRSRK